MVRRTKEEAEQTRGAILDAAERLFLERGVARTSLEQVARGAGVTRGAVYWHFRDKVALFEAMQARARLPQEDVLECLLAARTAAPEALNRLGLACRDVLHTLAHDDQRRRVYTILLRRCEYVEEMHAAAERMRHNNRQVVERVTRFFALAAESGTLAPHWSPPLAALALDGLMFGLITRLLESERPGEVATLSQDTVDAFFRSLSNPARHGTEG
jgi:AcrR family transcriptional regulator